MERHHLHSFLDQSVPDGSTASSVTEDVQVDRAAELKSYHAALSKSLRKAVSKKLVSEQERLPAFGKRPSQTDTELKNKSAWLKSQADVYMLRATSEARKRDIEDAAF